MGRLVFVCGGSAAGKTTVAEELKRNHGFVHFDGDLWCAGLTGDGPITHSGRRPSADDMKRCPDEMNQLRNNFYTGFFDKAVAGETADLVACEALYRAMARDVHKLAQSEAYAERDVVVSHVVVHRVAREVLRRVFGPELECLVLATPREVLVERRMARMEAVAASQGKTIEALAMSYPGTGTWQERVEAALKRCVPVEPLTEEEPRSYQLDITGEMDEAAVAKKAREHLGLVSAANTFM